MDEFEKAELVAELCAKSSTYDAFLLTYTDYMMNAIALIEKDRDECVRAMTDIIVKYEWKTTPSWLGYFVHYMTEEEVEKAIDQAKIPLSLFIEELVYYPKINGIRMN